MIDTAILLKLVRFASQGLSLMLGSVGVLMLWASFYRPDVFGLDALYLLGSATALTLGAARPSR